MGEYVVWWLNYLYWGSVRQPSSIFFYGGSRIITVRCKVGQALRPCRVLLSNVFTSYLHKLSSIGRAKRFVPLRSFTSKTTIPLDSADTLTIRCEQPNWNSLNLTFGIQDSKHKQAPIRETETSTFLLHTQGELVEWHFRLQWRQKRRRTCIRCNFFKLLWKYGW